MAPRNRGEPIAIQAASNRPVADRPVRRASLARPDDAARSCAARRPARGLLCRRPGQLWPLPRPESVTPFEEELIMNTLKAWLGATAGVIVLTATLTLTNGGNAAAQSMKPLLVRVTNTIAEAVPVRTVLPAADRVLLEWRGGSGDPCPSFALPVA